MTLSHGGDLGDTIYALPTIRQLVKYDETGDRAHLILYAAHGRVREPWSPTKVERVRDFFQLQPYIASVAFSRRASGTNLDMWRTKYDGALNLADMVSRAFKVADWVSSEPWAFVDNLDSVAPVVFHRSPRYHGAFCWSELVERYRGNSVFVGSEAEYTAFTADNGFVPYFPTPTLLTLARVIAGCGLFVGNQSAPRAIAEALKVPVWVEECLNTPNTRFTRPDAGYGPDRVAMFSA